MDLIQETAPDRLVCVQITYGDAKLARKAARDMVERGLAACVQQVRVSSTYRWQGQVEEDAEQLLTAKTIFSKVAALEAFVRDTHPYDEPEFLIVPALGASEGYARWVRESVNQ